METASPFVFIAVGFVLGVLFAVWLLAWTNNR